MIDGGGVSHNDFDTCMCLPCGCCFIKFGLLTGGYSLEVKEPNWHELGYF